MLWMRHEQKKNHTQPELSLSLSLSFGRCNTRIAITFLCKYWHMPDMLHVYAVEHKAAAHTRTEREIETHKNTFIVMRTFFFALFCVGCILGYALQPVYRAIFTLFHNNCERWTRINIHFISSVRHIGECKLIKSSKHPSHRDRSRAIFTERRDNLIIIHKSSHLRDK